MEVANGGFFGGTSTDAEGLVLEDLEFINVVFEVLGNQTGQA